MVFSDSTNKLGIVEKIDFECDTDSTSYPIAQKIREINTAYEKVNAWIINNDGTWQFDDENYSTIPEGATDLVAGQSDYSFSAAFLEIEWVKIKDANGRWKVITPIDQSQVDFPLEDYLITNGFPQHYDKVGNVIRLYPAPATGTVTLSGGMKIAINRTASLFTSADTTKTPGFVSPFHVILAYMAALPYCAKFKKDRVANLIGLIGDTQIPTGLKRDILDFYGHRERDARKVMTSAPVNPR